MEKNKSILEYKKLIFAKNEKNRKKVLDELKKYKEIKINYRAGYGKGKYEYDFLWLDGEYQDIDFRICFYNQDIDPNSYNIHIFHDKYTFQKKLVKNDGGPKSIFDINLNCRDSFNRAINNMKVSKYGIENFELAGFIEEFLLFLKSNFLIDTVFLEYKEKFKNKFLYLYQIYSELNTQIKKYAFYKVVAQDMGIDVDSSNYVISFFKEKYDYFNNDWKVKPQTKKFKYELMKRNNDEYTFRGETIFNPFSVLKKIYGMDAKIMLISFLSNSMEIKKRLYGIPLETIKLISEHIELCYSIGNFYPIPYKKDGKSLNQYKGSCGNDDIYIYLKRLQEYYEFLKDGKSTSQYYKEFFDYNGVFNQYESFEDYVKYFKIDCLVENNNPIDFYSNINSCENGNIDYEKINMDLRKINDTIRKRTMDLLDIYLK